MSPRRREILLAGAFLVLGEVSLYLRMLGSGLRETAGDYVNHLLANFVLEHSYLWLIGRPDHASFWDVPVYWPAQNVLAYAETMIGSAVLYWPWRLLGVAPDTAYQIWLLALPLLGFAAAWLLFRDGFGFPALPAAAGSFLCAFGKTLGAQVNNPQLHTLFYTYFGLYCLCRIFREPGKRQTLWVAGLFASLVGQLHACFYLGWLFLFFAGIAALAMLLIPDLRPRLLQALRANLLPALVVAPLAALALLPLVSHSLAVVRDLGWSNETGVKPMLPHLRSWLYMGRRSPAYFWLSRTDLFAGLPAEPEERLGVGFVTWICAAIGVWTARRNPWMRLLAILACALVVLSTEFPGGFSLWHGVREVVPGARALRYVGRIGVLLMLPAGIGLASFLASRERRLATWALLGLCLVEQPYFEYTFPKDRTRAVVGRFAAAVDPRCPSFHIAVRQTRAAGTPHWVSQVEIAMAQLQVGIPTVNGGYTRFQPPGYGDLYRNVIRSPQDAGRLRRDLAAWRTLHGLRPEDVCGIEIDDPHEQFLQERR